MGNAMLISNGSFANLRCHQFVFTVMYLNLNLRTSSLVTNRCTSCHHTAQGRYDRERRVSSRGCGLEHATLAHVGRGSLQSTCIQDYIVKERE